jgi:hypothetical protein
MARLATAVAVFVALLCVVDLAADRLVHRDTITDRAIMNRARAFQDFFFARMRDLQSDIGLAAVRTYARWSELSPRRAPGEFRIVLVGNSAGLFAVSPADVARRLAGVLPDRSVTVIPLMVPSAVIADQVLLAKVALDRSANGVVALIDWDGFRSSPGVASRRIAELFTGERDATGLVADVDRWLDEHWTLYRMHAILRAMSLDAASHLFPALVYDRAPLDDALARIDDATRRGNVYILREAYWRVGYTPMMRAHYRGEETDGAATLAMVDALGATLARAPHLGMGIVMPFNPLLRADILGVRIVDPRAANKALRVRTDETIRRLRRAGCEAADELDALPATDFIDYVHVNARGARRFSIDVAKLIRNALRKTVARRIRPPGPTATGVPHRIRHVPVLG